MNDRGEGRAGLADIPDRTWDAIVIGAGPAGALSALLAARAGATTLLVERKRFPRLKVCGGCLNASAVGLLESLGLGAIVRQHGLPINRLDVGMRGRRASLALPGGVAISRATLDSELVRYACDAGAMFLAEAQAVVGKDDGIAREVLLSTHGCEQMVRGRVVIVASGLGVSAMTQDQGFSTRVARRSRLGAGCVIEDCPAAYASGRISMAIGRSGYVGLTRTIEGLIIGAAMDGAFLKHQGGPGGAAAAILEDARFPPVPDLLTAEWSGTLPLTRSTRPIASSRLFLVGDSAGYVEPFTGQGMAIALQGAFSLSPYAMRAIAGWSPALATAWSREYARNAGSWHWPAALLASIARRPGLARLAFDVAGALPIVPRALIRVVNRPILVRSSC